MDEPWRWRRPWRASGRLTPIVVVTVLAFYAARAAEQGRPGAKRSNGIWDAAGLPGGRAGLLVVLETLYSFLGRERPSLIEPQTGSSWIA
jgi:hypothetical protein